MATKTVSAQIAVPAPSTSVLVPVQSQGQGSGGELKTPAAEERAPVSSETSLRETALPVKNSPTVSEGSIKGAGGKMSDWNESDYSCGSY